MNVIQALSIQNNAAEILQLQNALDKDQRNRFSLTNVNTLGDGLARLAGGRGEERFDIVLLGINFAAGSCPAAVEKIKSLAPALPIVVCANETDEEQSLQALQTGVQDCLVKTSAGFSLAARSIRAAIERQRAAEVISAQRDLARMVGAVVSHETALPLCLEIAIRISGMDSGGIYLFDENKHSLDLVSSQGLGSEFVRQAAHYAPDTPNVHMLRSGKILYLTTAELSQQKIYQDEGLTVIISLPIQYQGRVMGCINVASHTLDHAPEQARRAFETIAGEIGHVLISLHTKSLLRKSEALLAEAQRVGRIGYWEWNVSNNEMSCSAEFFRLYDIPQHGETIAREDIIHLLSPSERERLFALDKQAFADHTDMEYDFSILLADGQTRWLRQQAKVTYGADGAPERILGIVQDITARKLADEKERASEKKYRELMESLDSAIVLINPGSKLLYLNHVAAQQLGGDPQDLIGKTMFELFPPEIADRQWEHLRRVFHQDQCAVIEAQTWVQGKPRWHRTLLQPMHDENGRVAQVLINSTDIDDLKTAQQALQELNRTLEERVRQRTAEVQELYDNAPAGYHSLDKAGKILMVNQTELNWLGYTREEMIGRSMIDFLSPAGRAKFLEDYPRAQQRGGTKEAEYELQRKDGSVFSVMVNAYAIYDEQGSYVMSRSTMHDNTERKRVEDAMRRANHEMERAMRMKDEFLASMSHELRTPLTGILGLSEALQLQTYGALNEKQLRALKNIETSGRHLLELINDILDLSKIEAGKLDMQLAPCSVAEICQASLQLIKGMAHKKQLSVSFVTKPATLRVQADARRLKQTLVNLLSNAVKFTPEGGSLGIEVEQAQGEAMARITVWDTGIGIATENLDRLFQPFVQLDSSLARQHSGTGLGLSLVKRMTELHHGKIEVQSNPGQGSRFTLSIPLVSEETPPPQRSARFFLQAEGRSAEEQSASSSQATAFFSAVKPSGAQLMIAVVDDNEINIETISDMLVSRQFQVSVAHSGQEFLDQIGRMVPDLALLDIQMPGIDGIEVIQRMRAHSNPAIASIPVIAITALAMPGDRERCLAAGANGYMSKPVRLQELLQTIQQCLADRKKI